MGCAIITVYKRLGLRPEDFLKVKLKYFNDRFRTSPGR